MKKVIIALSALLCFILVGCSTTSTTNQNSSSDIVSEVSSAPTSEPNVSEPDVSEPDVSEPVSSELNDTKISEEKAIEIAEEHWGIKSGDVDEETGFSFLIMPVESENENYRIALKWLVDNHHYSTLDWIEIDVVTGEIITQ